MPLFCCILLKKYLHIMCVGFFIFFSPKKRKEKMRGRERDSKNTMIFERFYFHVTQKKSTWQLKLPFPSKKSFVQNEKRYRHNSHILNKYTNNPKNSLKSTRLLIVFLFLNHTLTRQSVRAYGQLKPYLWDMHIGTNVRKHRNVERQLPQQYSGS